MNKIIVSSYALCKMLQEVIRDTPDETVGIECKNKKLRIGNLERTLDVESKSEWVVTLPDTTIGHLLVFVKSISDQPLVLTFNESSNFIQVDNVLI